MRVQRRRIPVDILLGGVVAPTLVACGASTPSPAFTYRPTEAASASQPGPSASTESPSVPPSVAPATASPTQDVLSFTPGTTGKPRIVEVAADDLLNFTPGLIQAAVGETVTFRIHNNGKATHEFMVGPLADAFADKEGTPEVADIAAGTTGEITFTFDGTGPFAFACHAP
jgi:plastocyanin